MKRETKKQQMGGERHFENLHVSFTSPREPNLDRIISIHQERRIVREPVIDTVVTYGAYEDPI